MQALELKIPPVAVVFIVALLMWFTSRFITVLPYSFVGQDFIAWGIYVLGAFCSLLGVYQFRKAQTTVDPRYPEQVSSLVRAGIYRYSRNPMYLGFLLILLGWAIQLSELLSFVYLPLFVAYMNRFQIIPEERFIASKFGADFIDYQSSVRRWL